MASFGQALRFYLRKEESELKHRQPAVNAFSVMISAQRQLSARRLPQHIEQPWNKKDNLYNAVLDRGFLKQEQLFWTSSEVSHGVATSCV